MFVLHSGQAVPAGGLLQAAGKMWVAPAAEADPRAIAMEAGGSGLNAAALAAAYLGPDQVGNRAAAAAAAAVQRQPGLPPRRQRAPAPMAFM